MSGEYRIEYKPAIERADMGGLHAGAKTLESARRAARNLICSHTGDWVARISRYTDRDGNQTLEFIPPSAKGHFLPLSKNDRFGAAVEGEGEGGAE